MVKSSKKSTKLKKLTRSTRLTNKAKKTLNLANLEYPYYQYLHQPTKSEILNLAKNVKNKIIMTKQGNLVILDDWKRNYQLNQVTDLFTEKCRVTCQFLHNPTPIQYWQDNREKLLDKITKYPTMSSKISQLRELIYQKTKLCNNFRISVVLSVLKMYQAKRWLDISAGWGDRLIGAILHGVQYYCGVDPNPCVQAGYQDILNFFQADRSRFHLIQDGFETAKLPTGKTYDLVFTSPPFFDLETYSSESGDSLTSYGTEDKWLNGFLIPSVKKATQVLESKGHLILYIAESKGTNYLPKLKAVIKSELPELKEKKSFYYQDAGHIKAQIHKNKGKLREFLVWQKF